MKDAHGRTVMLGDRVKLWGENSGTVVCAFDEGRFSEKFHRESWGYVKTGALIEADSGELFHYEEADEDFEIIAPADGQSL